MRNKSYEFLVLNSQAIIEFFSVDSEKNFQEKYNANCICETFNTKAPEGYLQIEIDGQKWIDYAIARPNQIHKAMITLNGKDNILSVTATVLPGEDNTLKSAVFTDITELEQAKNEIELILSNIMLPILITSKNDRKILYANEFAQVQYEKNIEELIGSDIDDVYTIKGQQYHIIEKIEKDGKIEGSDQVFKTSTGKKFSALLSVTPISYQNEEAYIGMVVDITKQKEIEEEIRSIHKHTRDSIEYASLIQGALIPETEVFNKYFKDFFIIWEPKDIVGGDIYLFEELRNDNECLIMVIDCTGHGVPGAFVTMLVKAIERQLVSLIAQEKSTDVSPAYILSYFNKTIKKLLKQEDKSSVSNAGFDAGVIYYNKSQKLIKFAGAYTSLFYVEDNSIQEIKGDRHSIGYKKSDINYQFKDNSIKVKNNMKFYCTTDGYIDQNGGEKGFCMGRKRFKEIIQENHEQPMLIQKEIFTNNLQQYQADTERNDDVTVIGFEISSE